jgi:hypothetical protein
VHAWVPLAMMLSNPAGALTSELSSRVISLALPIAASQRNMMPWLSPFTVPVPTYLHRAGGGHQNTHTHTHTRRQPRAGAQTVTKILKKKKTLKKKKKGHH